MSSLLVGLLGEAAQLDKKKFLVRYPHPWLLSELVKLPNAIKQGAELRSINTDSMLQANQRLLATKPSIVALKARTDSFVLLPIAKSDRNLWADRVLLGRAANNDVVIEDPSVSKAHAYFIVKGGRAELVALPTVNPTKLASAVIAPHDRGTAVPDNAVVEFGNAGFRYLEAASLYALLTAKS